MKSKDKVLANSVWMPSLIIGSVSAVEKTVQRMRELRLNIARTGIAVSFTFSRLAVAQISCRDALMCWAENCIEAIGGFKVAVVVCAVVCHCSTVSAGV